MKLETVWLNQNLTGDSGQVAVDSRPLGELWICQSLARAGLGELETENSRTNGDRAWSCVHSERC